MDETLHPASVEVEQQLRRLETIADPAARGVATDLVAAVLRFHTAALDRMLEIVDGSSGGSGVLAAFDADPLVRSMLLIHDLHPEPLEARIGRAITELEPALQSRAARIEIVSAGEALVRVRVRAGKSGHSLRPSIEQALRTAVPEVAEIIIDEPAPPGFVPLEALQSSPLAHSELTRK